MRVILHVSSTDIFLEINSFLLKKKTFRKVLSERQTVWNQDVGPDLVPNCFQQMTKDAT